MMESSLTERAIWRDYYELCKPNVVWLMILTAIVGMCMATTGAVPLSIVVAASVGIARVHAGAEGCYFVCVFDGKRSH